ncbi:MAG: VanW family protein [Candidatus Chisholmbacteria bacterium]|nr:VanW family protein [Candidatus Chisholmbacteria bacterium]
MCLHDNTHLIVVTTKDESAQVKQSRAIGPFFQLSALAGWVTLALGFVVGAVISLLAFELIYWGKVYPRVLVQGLRVEGKTEYETEALLASRAEDVDRIDPAILLKYQENEWPILKAEIGFSYLPAVTARQAMKVGREGSTAAQLGQQWRALTGTVRLPLDFTYDEELLMTKVATVAAELSVPPVPPEITVLDRPDPSGSWVEVQVGESGTVVDVDEVKMAIDDGLRWGTTLVVALPVKVVDPGVSAEELEETRQRAEKLVGKTLTLTSDEQRWSLEAEDLVTFLDFKGGFSQEKIVEYGKTLAEATDRQPQDAAFQYVEGRVTQFRPAKDGLRLETEKAVGQIESKLDELLTTDEEVISGALSVVRATPSITLEDVNNLGINELLGRGVSTYTGSIAGRRHNIALSANRINGVLVAPGQEFSFNASVGEISNATGYQQAYVIRSGATVLDDGGGVCQVSTTVFRAALDAGLPITARRAHSYRVGYYEQNAKAGLDATVYAPTTDLKFLNDTPAHILVQMINNAGANTLSVEIYGTSDGRTAQILNHRVWDIVPAPPPRYQDDPTLGPGVVKQIDYEAAGAKAKFDYVVTRGGETIYSKTFLSNFQPWQAVYLRGV